MQLGPDPDSAPLREAPVRSRPGRPETRWELGPSAPRGGCEDDRGPVPGSDPPSPHSSPAPPRPSTCPASHHQPPISCGQGSTTKDDDEQHPDIRPEPDTGANNPQPLSELKVQLRKTPLYPAQPAVPTATGRSSRPRVRPRPSAADRRSREASTGTREPENPPVQSSKHQPTNKIN